MSVCAKHGGWPVEGSCPGCRTEASSTARANASFGAVESCSGRRCGWCRSLLEASATPAAIFCGRKCRQAAFRLRRRRTTEAAEAGNLTFAYADPPYPGLARKYYAGEASFAGEVDHEELVASLTAAGYAGWALSTSSKALRDVLPLCPERARVGAWVKPIGASPRTYGMHSCWEPLIVVSGRALRPGVRDFLRAQPARGGGELPGRKPVAFCAWLFDCLGMLPGDKLVDLYPGTGIVSRAWELLSLKYSCDGASFRSWATSSGDDGDSSHLESATPARATEKSA